MSGPSTGDAVKAKLSALAARHSHGATSDPSSLTTTSSKNAKLPAADALSAKAGKGKGKSKAVDAAGKGKAMSAKKKKKVEKAEGLKEVLENKYKQKEGRKAQRDRAKRAWD